VGAIDSVAISPDGSRLYLLGTDAGVVKIVHTATKHVTPVTLSGNSPAPAVLALSPDGSRLYVAGQGHTEANSTSLWTLDATSGASIDTVQLPNSPGFTLGLGDLPAGMAVAPNGKLFTGTGSGEERTITPPATLSPTPVPTITGTAKVGHTLTADPGSWGPGMVTLHYSWYANGAAITGATARTLKLSAAQYGKTITVKVRGTETGYLAATKTSAPTDKVAAGTLSPTPTPKIDGVAVVGDKLTAKPGAWGPGSVRLHYHWYANRDAIAGATSTTFTITRAQRGMRITVAVTGSKDGYTTVTKTSLPTAKVTLP
jgi:DNA-binding beta-propeller fold protein YncE